MKSHKDRVFERLVHERCSAAFDYFPLIDHRRSIYVDHRLVVIGKRVAKCRHGEALKWNEETPGMCWSIRKVSSSNRYYCTMTTVPVDFSTSNVIFECIVSTLEALRWGDWNEHFFNVV